MCALQGYHTQSSTSEQICKIYTWVWHHYGLLVQTSACKYNIGVRVNIEYVPLLTECGGEQVINILSLISLENNEGEEKNSGHNTLE